MRCAPASSSGSITFSSAVIWGSNWKDWNTKPRLRERQFARASSFIAKRSSPNTSTRPLDGASSPASSPSRVDLPEPDAPTTATVAPASTSNPTSSRIVSQPSESLTRLPSDSTRSATMTHPDIIEKPTILPEPMRRCVLFGIALLAGAGIAASRGAQGAEAQRVLVLGDSSAAAYYLTRGSGRVQQLADQAGDRASFINASISGETTAGGRSRLPGLLAELRPDIVIIELGANDALRGLQLAASEENLDAMVSAARASDAQVLVLGMQVPPNYGRRYTERFAGIFETVAQRHDAVLVPFL